MACPCPLYPVCVHAGSAAEMRAGPRWWQQLSAQVRVLTLSVPPAPPHPPAGWRPRSCAAGTPSSSGCPRLPRSGAGGVKEMVREVLDPSPREEVHPQRGGGTRQPGEGAHASVSPEPTTPENTPRCDDEVQEPGAQGGCLGRRSLFPAETQAGVQGAVGGDTPPTPAQAPT